jgi:alpha-D-xyloside xylohydrolase
MRGGDMKFTNGYWLTREGVQINSLIEIVDVKVQEKKATLYVVPKNIRHRGDTLDGGMITIEITSPQENTFKVSMDHFKGGVDRRPQFGVKEDARELECSEGTEKIVITAGLSKVVFARGHWEVRYYFNGSYITGTSWRSTAYITGEKNYMREQFELSINESIYGLGERFTPFVKNGQSVDIWNEDGGTATEQAYKNIPFYLSTNNYGLFVNHPERVSYEIASELVSRVSVSVEGEYLEYYLIFGENMAEILEKYTDLTGRPSLPPLWSFGLWLSTSFTTNYDEATVNQFVEKMKGYNIPLSVFHYDCFWMKAHEWMNFRFDEDMFPDPRGMLERLKKKGLKICVWINPYIAQKSPLFDEAVKKRYLIRKKDGSIWQCNKWQAGMGIVDFTNPGAKKWYQDNLRSLIDLGVDTFKTDFGERIPTDVLYFNGDNPEKMHNYYTQMYNSTVFEVLQEEKGEDAMVFARSATTGGQRFPVHWGGDCSSTYSSMAESLRGGLSLTMSGFGFWSHDISGFESTATPDLYKRWVQFGLLSTHSRLHGSSSYRVPWLFDEEAVEVLQFFSELKCRLTPYLFNNAIKTSKSGFPSMSPMVLNFQNDMNCRYLDTQYMLGRDILVAPIFNDQSLAMYYLPPGIWTHLLSGEVRVGGTWYEEKYDYFSLPLFVKANTILPLGKVKDSAMYGFDGNLEFHFYNVSEQSLELYDEKVKILGKISAVQKEGKHNIKHSFKKPLDIKIFTEGRVEELRI